jgi:molybdopterin-containing oxidoreductase family iron-sulfur binding subunit
MNRDHETPNSQRRDVLVATVGGLTTAVALGGGVVLHTVAQATPPQGRTTAVTNEHRWGLLIDTSKCIESCHACVDACERENGLNLQSCPDDADVRQWENQRSTWIRKVKVQDNLSGRVVNLPLMCQHCQDPPCVDVCPTGASFKRADGIVMVDRHLCIGCRYCMMACPYKARSFIHSDVEQKLTTTPRGKGCVESCNMCAHLLDAGATMTACAEACQAAGHGAMVFGDLNDLQSPLHEALRSVTSRQIREDLGLNPSVRYTGI